MLNKYFEEGNESIRSEKKYAKNLYVKGSEWWKPMPQDIQKELEINYIMKLSKKIIYFHSHKSGVFWVKHAVCVKCKSKLKVVLKNKTSTEGYYYFDVDSKEHIMEKHETETKHRIVGVDNLSYSDNLSLQQ